MYLSVPFGRTARKTHSKLALLRIAPSRISSALARRVEVVTPCRPIEEKEHPRVDHPKEAGARNLPQYRLAIDPHEQGRPLADDDPRRVVLDLDDPAGIFHSLHFQLGLKPIQRDRQRLA